MFPDFLKKRISNDRGFGLIAAIFAIVILAMFGLLIARFISSSSVSSAEDYLWTQALYSAESAAQLRILECDGGGNWGAFTFPSAIENFSINATVNDCNGLGSASTLKVNASRSDIMREILVNYVL